MLKKLSIVSVGIMFLFVSSCGTLLKSSRINKPRSNQLDYTIVALNSVGILFFVVPGIVAFAVDFATGAIYYPKY